MLNFNKDGIWALIILGNNGCFFYYGAKRDYRAVVEEGENFLFRNGASERDALYDSSVRAAGLQVMKMT